MDWQRYLRQSVLYYWRMHLAVFLGVLAGAAAITGALIVGDTVRYSLRQMTVERLGRIDHVLASHRFFREQLAEDLQKLPDFAKRFSRVAPAVWLTGSLERSGGGRVGRDQSFRRVGGVNVWGVDERLWQLTRHGDLQPPRGDEVLLSARAAAELDAAAGDSVTLWVQLPASVPRDTLLGGGDKPVSAELTLTVRGVIPEDVGVGRLDLKPSQQIPKSAFVSLATLQHALGLSEQRPSRRNPEGRPARVNTLLVSAKTEDDASGPNAEDAAHHLTALLSRVLQLADLRLKLRPIAERHYLSLESERLYLEDPLANAGELAAETVGLPTSPVLVYLANELANAKSPEHHYSMYSIIAGVVFEDLPPFGPFRFVGLGRPPSDSSEIVINEWLAKDLNLHVGDTVRVRYYEVGSRGELPEKEREFTVAGILALDGTPADDRHFTPEVKGITDVDDVAGWDQPFPMKLDRITDRDEQYWDRYRATPKAFVRLETAVDLWGNRYGRLTSLRIAVPRRQSLERVATGFSKTLIQNVYLPAVDLAFDPVKYNGLQAASGTTDFAGLFIGFSFFLILSAVILIGLLFRLGIERRGRSIGLLAAVGLTPQQVRWLFLAEGLLVVGVGGLVGQAAAVGYAALMVHGLKTWWVGAIGTRFLFLDVEPLTLVIGFVISVSVAAAAIVWSFRGLRTLSTRELLAGTTDPMLTRAAQRRRGRRAGQIAAASLVVAAVLSLAALLGLVPASEAFEGLSWQVVTFFIVGICMLTASLSGLSAWLDSDRVFAVRGAGLTALARMGLRNAARHRQRSVLSTGLIASAAFVIVAVAAGHRNPAVEAPDLNSGNGGFLFVAESAVPILYDMNSPEGREKLDLTFADNSPEAEILRKMFVVPFRMKPGENASCLNIFQTRQPTILGVPHEMIERGGFKFANTRADNPWKLLEANPGDGTVPVLGDMNTLMYSLHKGIGDTLDVGPGGAKPKKLKIVGMLDGSVFQGVLLMSEANFVRLFPEQAGYRYFLIGDRRFEGAGTTKGDSRVDPTGSAAGLALTEDEAARLLVLLETRLAPYGFDAERVVDRLADFLAVQNTYLSTFQALGGLGLLLGTIGLATVMLRNVLERRSELALLRATGFVRSQIGTLVLWENAALLAWGLGAGTVSALLAMTPHLTSIGADVPWVSGALTLLAVFLVGMLAALAAVREATRLPVVESLRRE
ncbi:MAG: ABC transporter permease [Planctomycetes bacterium]|nr:ABC transporter permease [Planctomycetota bacterium]